MFKENMQAVINNLPLVLSDTTDPIDVSINRVLILLEFIIIFLFSPPLLILVFLYYRESFVQVAGVWGGALAQYTIHLGINSFKKK